MQWYVGKYSSHAIKPFNGQILLSEIQLHVYILVLYKYSEYSKLAVL